MKKIDYGEKSTSFTINANIRGIEGIFIILSLSLLFVTYEFNSYIMFHTLAEFFILFICFSIFIISINSDLNDVKQNCLRLIRIINNIIDITKIDSGFLQPCFKNYDIINVIEDITQSVEEYARNKSIEIIFDTDSEEKIMSFDPDLMERMILNLLSNAVKFTREGGTIEINVWSKDNSVVISIKDSGIGIPENKKDIIFDRFRQIDKSFIRENEGSGIGLSLVKSIVNMHKGSIVVSSKVGQGSEFIIELPSTLKSMDDEISCKGIEKSKVEQVNIEFSDIYF